MSEQLDPWKRDIPDNENRYEQQLELQLNKVADATEEEWKEWEEKELNWWAEIQIPFVAFMAFVQLFVFGGMLMAFYLIGKAV
tara:strand:- start:1360 stop:1608 length:249 start_codon:yes stop_codon:yes gene_type:complete